MSKRECIFAYTPPGADYPPFVLYMRGEKRLPGDTEYPFDMPGHTVSMELPDDQRALLLTALTSDNFDWGALQDLRKASR